MLIAIIGHGRSPEGRRWASRIDACDTVIRMWDWTWQDRADYGSRYDYGLIEIAPTLLDQVRRHNKAVPSKGWIGSQLHCGNRRVSPPLRTEIIDQRRWTRIGRAMGGIGKTGRLELTRGAVAACWAIENSEIRDKIVLVGFDNLQRGIALPLEEAFAPVYRANEGSYPFAGYIGDVTKFGNHDYAIEWPLLQALARLHAVEIVFADQAWTEKAAA